MNFCGLASLYNNSGSCENDYGKNFWLKCEDSSMYPPLTNVSLEYLLMTNNIFSVKSIFSISVYLFDCRCAVLGLYGWITIKLIAIILVDK